MSPLKTIQTAYAHRLVPSSHGADVNILISEFTSGINKLYLTSATNNISVTNLTYVQSEGVKSDYALTDESIENLNSLITLSGRNPYLCYNLIEIYNSITYALILRALPSM